MANQKHLAILKREVEIWNQWRQEHVDIQPDLSDADLRGANLRDADLDSIRVCGQTPLYPLKDTLACRYSQRVN